MFFFAASACLASIADEAPYCCRGEAWEMDRRCAAPFCNRTRDLVTGRRAVIKAEILLLTSVHEDVMLEGFIGDRREMAKCWIGKLEGIWNGALNWRSSFCTHARQGPNSRIPAPTVGYYGRIQFSPSQMTTCPTTTCLLRLYLGPRTPANI